MKSTIGTSEILRTSKVIEYKKNEVIAKEGDVEPGWFILLEGRVGVLKSGKKVEEFDKKGTIFGEISNILGTPRSASIIAIEKSKVLCFKASIDHLIERYPEMAKKIMVSLANRLLKTTEEMISITEE